MTDLILSFSIYILKGACPFEKDLSIIRPTFFYYLFYGTNFLKIGSGGPKKNENKSMFIPESMKKIKIKVIFIVISFIIFLKNWRNHRLILLG